jgi:hypothetical protein
MTEEYIKHIYYGSEMDYEGNPVKRTKKDYPYSYDPYVIYRNGKNSDVTDSVYSDRLFQWDPKLYNELSEKHFGNKGQFFSNRNIESIEKFLADYLNFKDLKLIVLMEGANFSSGYPYWVFFFRAKEKISDTINFK